MGKRSQSSECGEKVTTSDSWILIPTLKRRDFESFKMELGVCNNSQGLVPLSPPACSPRPPRAGWQHSSARSQAGSHPGLRAAAFLPVLGPELALRLKNERDEQQWQGVSSLRKHWLRGAGWNTGIKASLSHQCFTSLSNPLKMVWPLGTLQLIKGPSKLTSYLLPQAQAALTLHAGKRPVCLGRAFRPRDRAGCWGPGLRKDGSCEVLQGRSQFSPRLGQVCYTRWNELLGLPKGCRLPLQRGEKEGEWDVSFVFKVRNL